MSQTDHYKGKLTPLGQSVEAFCNSDEIPDYYDSVSEWFDDNYYKSNFAICGMVYSVQKEFVDEADDIFKSTKNQDGTIEFEVKYYNGGCGFNEAIDDALKNAT